MAYKPLPASMHSHHVGSIISHKCSSMKNYHARGKLWKRYGPLHVYAPPKEYLLALKILAGRDQDLADCRILLPQTHIRTRQQAQGVLNRYILPEAQQDEAKTIASSLDV